MIWLLSSSVLAQEPCHTLNHFDHTAFRQVFPPPPPSGEKSSIDIYELPNVVVSENFALRWGADQDLNAEQTEPLLLAFENAWEHEINLMNFPVPKGADSRLFNVYIGNSGSNSPSTYGAAGYYSSDDAGWPMIVLDLDVLQSHDSYGVVPHEFFHAVQHACDTYSYDGMSAWYWESTAIWIENEVYPDEAEYSWFLFGFAFLPHKSLHFFNYPQLGEVSEYYQYGAFIFPKYLSTFLVEPMVVRDSWVDAVPGELPLEWWQRYFSDTNFHDIVYDFSMRNVYWDYPHQEWYQTYLDYYDSYFPNENMSITKTVNSYGEVGWETVPFSLLPEHYGVNYIRLQNPQASEFEIGVVGDTVGDFGSSVSWRVGLVRKTEENLSYVDLGAGDTTIIRDVQSEEELTLVIVPEGQSIEWGEQFSYEYLIRVYEEPVPEPEDAPKMSCSKLSSNEGIWAFWAVTIVLFRQKLS